MRILVNATTAFVVALFLSTPASSGTYLYLSVGGENKISIFSMDPSEGTLSLEESVSLNASPGALAVDPDRKYLFASLRSSELSSFRIDPSTGNLTPVSTVNVGASAAYVSTDRTGRYLFSAYYRAGNIKVHGISENGALSESPLQTISTAENAHSILPDRSNRFVFVPHTGPRAIFQFRLDEKTGRLSPGPVPRLATGDDTGPRHLGFHPALDVVYFDYEQGSGVGAYRLDGSRGTLERFQTISTLPKGFDERNICADIELTPDGRFLYSSNRGHDSIAGFSVDAKNGELTSIGQTPTEKTPRSFNIDPSGKFLYAAGQGSGKLASYRIDSRTGKLEHFTTIEVGPRPSWVMVVKTPDETANRIWIGPEYWANPLEDWRLQDGRIECINNQGNRNLHILTHQLADRSGDLEMELRVGAFGEGAAKDRNSWAGFRIGIHDSLNDYRRNVFHGQGMNAGITMGGSLFIGAPADGAGDDPDLATQLVGDGVKLRLTTTPSGGSYAVRLEALDAETGKVLAETTRERIRGDALLGNLALVCDPGQRQGGGRGAPARPGGLARAGTRASFWFRNWTFRGSKLEIHPEQTFGPILFAMHTLSRGVLKLTAQLPPIGRSDSRTVRLEIRPKGSEDWKEIASAPIDSLSRTATFRIEDWSDRVDTPYRLVYGSDSLTGTIRRDPVDKEEIVVAGFTGNTDAGFPNPHIVRNISVHDPDVLFFSGDQIYENVGGYGIHRRPADLAVLTYLRKWYMWGWSFRDLLRDRPALCLPDDHDVFQGNIWGEGGKPVANMADHPRGGYHEPPEFVNAVQRTQSAHHPDPFDPTPIEQGITVYYGDMVYGRISFAILEDRKFKSGPQDKVNHWKGRPDHVVDTGFDPGSVDKPGLKLLGDRQLLFLKHWAADWRGADMKVACSQTILANVANYHGGNQMFLVADLDSNGWPQSGRNRALHELRRGFAFMYAGDQHLPSVVHHGSENWNDSGYSFCVPSTAAGYPRAWRPQQEGKVGKNRKPGWPDYAGEFVDGLGNKITVLAVGNPEKKQRSSAFEKLHDKSSGYGLVRFRKPARTITMECWRLLADVTKPGPDDQFPGWPVTIEMRENYGRKAAAHLPAIEVRGMTDPVIQIIDESDQEIVYTLRIAGNSFRPGIFKKDATYTVKVGEQETGQMQIFSGVKPSENGVLRVDF